MNLKKARWEFSTLIDRCGCSRAGVYITEKEIEETGLPMHVQIPSCTPHLCFPELMKNLYPNGGFNKTSQMLKNTLRKMEMEIQSYTEKANKNE